MQTKTLALAACALLSACGHVVRSERCDTYWNCPSSVRGEAFQTYALPVTIVDFTFAKPATTWTLTAATRNLPDDDPRYRYRLNYDPHSGADDDLTLTVQNGLLTSTESNASTQLPDVVDVLSPVARTILAGGSAVSGAVDHPTHGRWDELSPDERRNAVLAEGPVDAFEYSPFAGAVSCTVEQLLAGSPQFEALARRRAPDFSNTCQIQVGARVRTVRLSCANAPREMLSLNEMRAIFGTVTAKSACTGDGGRTGEFAFDYTVGAVQMLIAADPAAQNYRHWTGEAAGPRPYSVEGCEGSTDDANSAGCFPTGREGGLFYRTTAPLQTATALCRQDIVFTDNAGTGLTRRLGEACEPVMIDELPYAGSGHRFAAIVRRSAYAIDLPRGVGQDHRKYTFVGGVLETVDVNRTGALLGLVRLPLTILGIGD